MSTQEPRFKKKKKTIAHMDKECSFIDLERDRHGKLRCRKTATSGVVAPTGTGNLFWRCPEHQGLYTAAQPGEVRFEVEVYG